MNINEEKRHQWQALKGMGFKAHWDYFWDYYKVHVIVAVILIVGIFSLVKDIVNQKPDAINVSIVNAAGISDASLLQTGFAEYEKIDTTKYNVAIDSTSAINLKNPDSYTIANSERIYSMIAAHDLDVIMADEDVFDNYSKNEMFIDLREYFSEEELNELGDKIFYVDTADYHSNDDYFEEGASGDAQSEDAGSENGSDSASGDTQNSDANVDHELIPVGVILKDNHYLNELEYYQQTTPVVGLAVSSERSAVGADFIRYLLK